MNERPERDATPTPPDTRAEVDPLVASLLGLRAADAEPIPSADEIEGLGEISDGEVRVGETDDPVVAAEEALTWIPPTDPPLRVGADGEPEVAAGFGSTAEDEPFDLDHHAEPVTEWDERTARVMEALRADAQTTDLVDHLTVETDGGQVIVRGVVADLDDEEAVLAVIDSVDGVNEIIDRLEVAALAEMREPS
jgi:BON domain